MAVLVLATQSPWITIPLAYGFVARVLTGPRLSPLGWIATRIVAPRLSDRPRLVPGPPKRFAQAIGALFCIAALSCWLAGDSTATYVLVAVLVVPATLEAGFGICVGCVVFARLMRVGVIPERICLECADLYGKAAERRRAERAATIADSA